MPRRSSVRTSRSRCLGARLPTRAQPPLDLSDIEVRGRNREPLRHPRAILSVSTDSEIIARSLDEPGAFSGIFERHVRPVGGYVRRRVGADAVDDVLSETFLVAFRRRKAFDLKWDSARPWLLGIATRLVKSHDAAEARQ